MKLLTFVAIVALVAWPFAASAATLYGKEVYTLSQNQSVNDDLYIASEAITISGVVNGDLVSAGGSTTLSGRITQDATVAGGTVNISGTVSDDLRVAGGNVTLNGIVGGDVFVAGGQIHIAPDAVIQGDLRAAGGQVIIDGRVIGDAHLGSGRIKLGETAVINGDLSYRSTKEAEIATGARIIGATRFNEIQNRFNGRQILAVSAIVKMLMFVVAALVFLWIFKTGTPKVVRHALSNFWPDTLRGFLVVIAVPVATILLFITVVGIPVAVIVLLGYITMMILGGAFSGMVFGSWLAKIFMKKDPAPVDWKTVILGTIALMIVQLVPLVGWVAGFVFFLVTLGALSRHWYENVWQNR